jgi:hypothetical protein
MNPKEAIESVADGIKERATNPFVASFLLFSATWNYRFFLVLFDDELASVDKFSLIENGVFSQYPVVDLAVIPLVSAVGFNLVLPIFLRRIGKLILSHKRRWREVQRQVSSEEVLGRRDWRRLNDQLFEQSNALEQTTEKVQAGELNVLELEDSVKTLWAEVIFFASPNCPSWMERVHYHILRRVSGGVFTRKQLMKMANDQAVGVAIRQLEAEKIIRAEPGYSLSLKLGGVFIVVLTKKGIELIKGHAFSQEPPIVRGTNGQVKFPV